jgi:hypothetical protein
MMKNKEFDDFCLAFGIIIGDVRLFILKEEENRAKMAPRCEKQDWRNKFINHFFPEEIETIKQEAREDKKSQIVANIGLETWNDKRTKKMFNTYKKWQKLLVKKEKENKKCLKCKKFRLCKQQLTG